LLGFRRRSKAARNGIDGPFSRCSSFYLGKNLGACGEGVAVVSNNPEVARKTVLLRDWGQESKYSHDFGTDLNLNKSTNSCLVANDTAIKIYEVRMKDADVLTRLNVFTNWHQIPPP
jgi:dTDP-4-amino-4,6-dideoxygalactose transaminase